MVYEGEYRFPQLNYFPVDDVFAMFFVMAKHKAFFTDYD